MRVIDVPFDANHPAGWSLTGITEGEQIFQSRGEALTHAMAYAKRYAFEFRREAYICVEGGDGKWRLFTPELQPVVLASAHGRR